MNLLSLIPRRCPAGEGSLRRSVLAWLLWLGNQSPSVLNGRESSFYRLKDRILKSHGEPDGYDLQRLEKECWDCNGSGCRRCIDGVYHVSRNRLDRYHIEGWVFHVPARIYSETEYQRLVPGARSVWTKTKERRHGFHFASNEAHLWLVLLILGPRAWWREMQGRCFLYVRLWYPLSYLQRVLWFLRFTTPGSLLHWRRACGIALMNVGWRLHPECHHFYRKPWEAQTTEDVPF